MINGKPLSISEKDASLPTTNMSRCFRVLLTDCKHQGQVPPRGIDTVQEVGWLDCNLSVGPILFRQSTRLAQVRGFQNCWHF